MLKKLTCALALLGAASLPAVACAQALAQADAVTVTRDPGSKKVRTATAGEVQDLHKGNGYTTPPRSTPVPLLQKYHSSGARGVRLNDEFMSSSVVTRATDGKLEMQCLEPGHTGQAPHPAHTTLQPVTE